jgi:hypothetical protein
MTSGVLRVLVTLTMLGAPAAFGVPSPEECERIVAKTSASCIRTVGMRQRRCYLADGVACPGGDAAITRAVDKLGQRILAACADDATVQGLGYGSTLMRSGLAARAQELCVGEPAAIVARTFGGPQATLLAGADAATQACLGTTAKQAVTLVRAAAKAYAGCLRKQRAGGPCLAPLVEADIAAAAGDAEGKIGAACTDLAATIGLDPARYVGQATAQARCVAAATHGATAPFALDCGARPAVSVPPRGTWTQVVLDSAQFGTRCGDGSDYAFWIRLAPTGTPLERVAVDLQGGGVCVFEADCVGASPSLFEALSDGHPSSGMHSTTLADNPFADWTMLYLPYCTQDVHIGGGVTQTFTSLTVERYGGVNVRAALRYLRDVLWQSMGETDGDGYRPDRLRVLFGGESAGAYGVNFNYHYVLDELRWTHTAAVPDAGLGLDNGELLGVSGLALIAGATWNTRTMQPSYCLAATCGVGPVMQAAHSVRLKAVPEQQVLNVSNQVDSTQVSTTFFASTAAWINELRESYCELQGTNGIRHWFPARTASFHTILTTSSTRWATVTAGGVTVRDWLGGAMADPDGVVDQVDEGTLVADYPGTNPIPCLP